VWFATAACLRVDSPEADAIEAGDRLLYVPQYGEVRLTVEFQLRSVPLLSRIGADRADQVRNRYRCGHRGLGGRGAAAA